MTEPTPDLGVVKRGRNRRRLAIIVMLAWFGGLGLLAKRELFRDRTAILAEAAIGLGPSATYFIVEQNGEQIGFASTTIDTSTTAFEVVDYFTADLPVGGQSFRASARSVITTSRSLALRTFDVEHDMAAVAARTVSSR